MKSIKISLVLLVTTLLVGCSETLNPLDAYDSKNDTPSAAVNRHNEIRAERYSGHKLVWSDELATSAQAHADYLADTDTFEHSSSSYGENLSGSSMGHSFVSAINNWYEEKSDFNPNTKACYGAWDECGHYTQMIWQETTEVGCGKSSTKLGGTIVVCQYNPPGNYNGETPY